LLFRLEEGLYHLAGRQPLAAVDLHVGSDADSGAKDPLEGGMGFLPGTLVLGALPRKTLLQLGGERNDLLHLLTEQRAAQVGLEFV